MFDSVCVNEWVYDRDSNQTLRSILNKISTQLTSVELVIGQIHLLFQTGGHF